MFDLRFQHTVSTFISEFLSQQCTHIVTRIFLGTWAPQREEEDQASDGMKAMDSATDDPMTASVDSTKTRITTDSSDWRASFGMMKSWWPSRKTSLIHRPTLSFIRKLKSQSSTRSTTSEFEDTIPQPQCLTSRRSGFPASLRKI